MPKRRADDTDELTGLPGMATLTRVVEGLLEAGDRVIAVFMLRITNLADLNVRHGPDVGDHLLAMTARRLAELVGEDRVARFQGPTFCFVVEDLGDETAVRQVVDLLLTTFRQPLQAGRGHVLLAPALGGALSSSRLTAGELLAEAGDALADSVDHGHPVMSDPVRRARAGARVTNEDLRVAVEQDCFRPHFQPIVVASTRQVVGFEALMRWEDPAAPSGVRLPADFLGPLERSGYAAYVGTRMLELGCGQLRQWAQRGHNPGLFMSVNVGAHQVEQPDFAKVVLEVVHAAGIGPAQLLIDLTDEALVTLGAYGWDKLKQLKRAGVRLGLNDFGLGRASLAVLREVPFDALRLPATFVGDAVASSENSAIVRHATALAHDLGSRVVAEGVERADQLEFVVEAGCDLAQGYLFGAPEPGHVLEPRLFPVTV